MTPERIEELRRLHAACNGANYNLPPSLVSALLDPIPDLINEIDRLLESLAIKTALLDESPKNMAKLARLRAILEPLRALEAAATGPEWTVQGSGGIRMDGIRDSYAIFHGPVKVCRSPVGAGNGPEQQRDDFAVIVAARNALPALLREIQETP
jgi:hypothetical protein